MGTDFIRCNDDIIVKVVSALEDLIVVSYNCGEKVFQGVLLDSTNRTIPFGVNPVDGFKQRLQADNPRDHQTKSTELCNEQTEQIYPTLTRRHTYFQDGKKDKPPLRLPSKSQPAFLAGSQQLGVRLRARQVLCSKCSSVCNERGINVQENSSKSVAAAASAVPTSQPTSTNDTFKVPSTKVVGRAKRGRPPGPTVISKAGSRKRRRLEYRLGDKLLTRFSLKPKLRRLSVSDIERFSTVVGGSSKKTATAEDEAEEACQVGSSNLSCEPLSGAPSDRRPRGRGRPAIKVKNVKKGLATMSSLVVSSSAQAAASNIAQSTAAAACNDYPPGGAETAEAVTSSSSESLPEPVKIRFSNLTASQQRRKRAFNSGIQCSIVTSKPDNANCDRNLRQIPSQTKENVKLSPKLIRKASITQASPNGIFNPCHIKVPESIKSSEASQSNSGTPGGDEPRVLRKQLPNNAVPVKMEQSKGIAKPPPVLKISFGKVAAEVATVEGGQSLDPGSSGSQNATGPNGLQNKADPNELQNRSGPSGLQNKPCPNDLQNRPGPNGLQNKPGPGSLQNKAGPSGLQNKPGPSDLQNKPGPSGPQSKPGPSGLQNMPVKIVIPKTSKAERRIAKKSKKKIMISPRNLSPRNLTRRSPVYYPSRSASRSPAYLPNRSPSYLSTGSPSYHLAGRSPSYLPNRNSPAHGFIVSPARMSPYPSPGPGMGTMSPVSGFGTLSSPNYAPRLNPDVCPSPAYTLVCPDSTGKIIIRKKKKKKQHEKEKIH